MAIQRRPQPMTITRTTTEEAAIAICKAVYPTCACERAPTICAPMMQAAIDAEKIFEGVRS